MRLEISPIFEKYRIDFLNSFILIILALTLVLDLFTIPGKPFTFDGHSHISGLAQYGSIFKSGDFPPKWANNFANYGSPLPQIIHQVPAYLGGFFNLFFNPTLSYNIVWAVAVISNILALYWFLRLYFNPLSSLVGSILFNFSAYRIFNIYIRAALPEIFSLTFALLSLTAIHALFNNKSNYSVFLLIFSMAGLFLTHPMLSVVFIIFIFSFMLFNYYKTKKYKVLILSFFSLILSLMIAGYYLLPLLLESKYTYLNAQNQNIEPQFLSFLNFTKEQWQYFDNISHPGIRPNDIQFGVIETFLLISSLAGIWLAYKKDKHYFGILFYLLLLSLIYIFFTISYSENFYSQIPFLSNIQFPWRMLNGLLIIPPFFLAYFIQKTNSKLISLFIIMLIIFMRMPQVYGKNYILYPEERYTNTILNFYGNYNNPRWTGATDEYPARTVQSKILEGEGEIEEINFKPSIREYIISTQTDARVIDYTFYFPGWKVYLNDQEIPIEYQDPQARGVITYRLPKGKNHVKVRYEDTNIRKFSKITSILGLFIVFLIVIFINRKKSFYA